MTAVTRARLAVAVLGLGVWGFGYRWDDTRVRWIGIAMLAAAVLMRFLDRPGDRGR
jgi:hypothetical protein